MNSNMKVAIILVTYNKLSYNKECIESIRKYTDSSKYELIVIDNNSTDGTKEWLSEQEGIKLILNNYNAGFIKGCNMGMNIADEDSDILLLNNDTVVTPKWLDNMLECLYSDNKIGVVGPMSNNTISEQRVYVQYSNMDQMIEFANEYNNSRGREWEQKIYLMGFCLLVKREAMNKAGLYLDELYEPGYFEDNDLCTRINQEGYKGYLCRNTFIHHYGSVSFREVDNSQKIVEESRWKYARKWGFDSATEPTVKGDLICQVYEAPWKELNILQYNCGLGCDLLKLKFYFPNATFYGIEKNDKLAAIAKHHVNISTEGIEDLTSRYGGVNFDYVILGDINKSSKELDNLINVLSNKITDGGYIIVYVKNLLHFSVVKQFIDGTITNDAITNRYYDLFTKNDVIEIFEKNGFTAVTINPFNIGGNEEECKFIRDIFDISNYKERTIDDYLVYNYVYKFKK